jgi:hypothetical protein
MNMKTLIKISFACLQKIAVVILCIALAGSVYNCGKRAESSGEVPYKPCPCEFDVEKPFMTIKGTAILVIDPAPDVAKRIALSGERVMSVFCDRTSVGLLETDGLPPSQLGSGAQGHICNFPDFAREWNTSEGIEVYFEGKLYPNCEFFGCRLSGRCYSVMLTKLIKIK